MANRSPLQVRAAYRQCRTVESRHRFVERLDAATGAAVYAALDADTAATFAAEFRTTHGPADVADFDSALPDPAPEAAPAPVAAPEAPAPVEPEAEAARAAGWRFDDAAAAAGDWPWFRPVESADGLPLDVRAVRRGGEWRLYVESAYEALAEWPYVAAEPARTVAEAEGWTLSADGRRFVDGDGNYHDTVTAAEGWGALCAAEGLSAPMVPQPVQPQQGRAVARLAPCDLPADRSGLLQRCRDLRALLQDTESDSIVDGLTDAQLALVALRGRRAVVPYTGPRPLIEINPRPPVLDDLPPAPRGPFWPALDVPAPAPRPMGAVLQSLAAEFGPPVTLRRPALALRAEPAGFLDRYSIRHAVALYAASILAGLAFVALAAL